MQKKYKADIIVILKDGVRDPQGDAIETVLKRIGLEKDPTVNVGKFFSIKLEGSNIDSAKSKLKQIAHEVLSNPVLEKYEILRFEEL